MALGILTKMLTATGVYWGSPIPDGYGNQTTVAPVEITMRWQDADEVIAIDGGREVNSTAKIFTSVDTATGGFLYLGTLASLSGEKDPYKVDTAKQIIKRAKLPTLDGTQFLRTSWV